MSRILLLLLASLFTATAAAQTIPIKTIPVAEGNQFMLFPSYSLGMGGVSIALEDPLLDPVTNPARGVALDGFRFSTSPAYYGFGGAAEGSGRTLPMGFMVKDNYMFYGATLAWQELVIPAARARTPQNFYGFGMVGSKIPGTQLSVGLSAFVAQLGAVEGVRLLYVNSDRVEQDGTMGLYRLGLDYAWNNGRTMELVLAHHRFKMEHDITSNSWWGWQPEVTRRTESDETRGWAVQLGYRQPIGQGVRLGARVAGDWKWHPKIPNYDLMQIPRDPGNSSAYRLGIGFSREFGQATMGLDLVYEPIWSHTWADAESDTLSASGTTIPAGAMTVENFFRFSNAHLRMGLMRTGDRFEFLAGLSVHPIRYWLDQENFVQEFTREQQEGWAEWTFSAGAGLIFPEFQIRYLGLLTLGTGQPGIDTGWGTVATRQASLMSMSDFLVAPNGPLTLQESRIVTHQISMIVPIGN